MIKPLLAITCPRDNIPEVSKYWPDLPCDKLLIKFVKEFNAYGIIRNYFLYEDDWTHLILSSDDLIVKPEDVKTLIKIIETHDYPVVSGVCNVDETDLDILAITEVGDMPRPETPYKERKYNFIRESQLPSDPSDNQMIRVGFAGFPLMAIRRDIVEKIPFETDYKHLGHPIEFGQSSDLLFCLKCQELGIPIVVDAKLFMKHLRLSGEIQVGKLPPDAVFYAYNPK